MGPQPAILFPTLSPGRAFAQQHLVAGWPQPQYGPIPNQDGLALTGPGEVAFFVLHPQKLKLSAEFEGDLSVSSRLSFNGDPIDWLEVRKDKLTATIPATSTRLGQNRLRIENGDNVSWKKFTLDVAAPPTFDKETLSIPAGGRADFYFMTPAEGSLRLVTRTAVSVKLDTPGEQQSYRLESGANTIRLQPGWKGQPCRVTLLSPDEELVEIQEFAMIQPVEKSPVETTPVDEIPPLVLLICIDTLRPDALGCYAGVQAGTPTLDALAEDSVVFTQARCQSGWTKSSVASALIGKTVQEHGVLDFRDKVPEKEVTLAELLQQAGFDTVGFTANQWTWPEYGFGQGFTRYEAVRIPLAETVVKLGLSYFKQKPAKPLFLYLHFLDPHDPYQPPSDFLQRADLDDGSEAQILKLLKDSRLGRDLDPKRLERLRELYQAETRYLDQELAHLINRLKELELYRDSLIIVFSDHGEEFLEHGELRHGHGLYEELLRMPLLVKLPVNRLAGSRSSLDVQHIDLLPTILAQCRVAPPAGLPGRNAFENANSAPRTGKFYMEFGPQSKVEGREPWLRLYECALWDRYKLLVRRVDTWAPEKTVLELYDLRKDPGERENILERVPVVFGYLCNELRLERMKFGKADSARPEDVSQSLRSLPYLR